MMLSPNSAQTRAKFEDWAPPALFEVLVLQRQHCLRCQHEIPRLVQSSDLRVQVYGTEGLGVGGHRARARRGRQRDGAARSVGQPGEVHPAYEKAEQIRERNRQRVQLLSSTLSKETYPY